MNKILFPGFNLEFNVSPIAIDIGNFHIYWYAICIVSGIVLSLILMKYTKQKFDINYEDFLEILIFILVFGILGARLYYVIFNFNYYIENFNRIWNIRDGGLAIYGGIITGGVVAFLLCNRKSISCLDFFDYVVPYLALSQAIGRLGNFFNVEAYGIEATNIFRMGIEVNQKYIEVHPTFLYELIFNIMIFIILRIIQKFRKFKGQVMSLYLILYGIARFSVEAFRADSLMFFNYKISQIVSIIFIIVGIILYVKEMIIHNVESNRKL